jgi:DNA-binding beta-propeller fold protein YncE
MLRTIAGGHCPEVDGIGTSVRLNPNGLAFDAVTGSVWVADPSANAIRRINRSTGEVSTFAGYGVGGFRDGVGTSAIFQGPSDVVNDNRGNLCVFI